FSSRRRHTSSDRDWSSDVCSSDLEHTAVTSNGALPAPSPPARSRAVSGLSSISRTRAGMDVLLPEGDDHLAQGLHARRLDAELRSEERRVGKESTSWGWAGA